MKTPKQEKYSDQGNFYMNFSSGIHNLLKWTNCTTKLSIHCIKACPRDWIYSSNWSVKKALQCYQLVPILHSVCDAVQGAPKK